MMDEKQPVTTLTKLREDEKVQKLIQAFSKTTIFVHSDVWQIKQYPIMLQFSSDGLDLLYRGSFLKMWSKTNINNETLLPMNIVTPFMEEASKKIRNYFAMVDYLTL